ncbi:hypothetical protein [Corallococcus exercitus]|uniref:hypothetical protein n=1 Tax=Corallococcus exercitus TaxID=2316736 RepID=UPI0035D41B8C
MKKLGYSLLLGAGLLTGPLAAAQGTSAQKPATPSLATPSAQSQAGCPCWMMGGGMGGAGMSYPMHGMADVKVEQTPTGAVLRLTAKDPAKVSEVQRMAQRMEGCMSWSGAQQGRPSAHPPAQRQP